MQKKPKKKSPKEIKLCSSSNKPTWFILPAQEPLSAHYILYTMISNLRTKNSGFIPMKYKKSTLQGSNTRIYISVLSQFIRNVYKNVFFHKQFSFTILPDNTKSHNQEYVNFSNSKVVKINRLGIVSW